MSSRGEAGSRETIRERQHRSRIVSRFVAPRHGSARHMEAKVAPQIDPETLEDLKHRAKERAEDLGHHLGPFQTAKHDPFCYVSFCSICRQIVIVSLERQTDRAGELYGYALEATCAARDATREAMLVSADAH